jgi:transcriptional regulator with XRE-family HTH domain
VKPKEYDAARKELGWTYIQLSEVLGLSPRTPYRHASGDTPIPPPVARLLRLLVLLRLTMSAHKFEKITEELCE